MKVYRISSLPRLLFPAMLLLGACTGNRPVAPALSRDQLFQRDAAAVLQEIAAMNRADQDVRHYLEYGTTDQRKVDSLQQAEEASGKPAGVAVLSQQDKDSAEKLMAQLQTRHTLRMLDLISRYGYPSSERYGDPAGAVDPSVVLHHPDPQYADSLLRLLEQELALGRVDTNTVELIRWDAGGREGIPALSGVTVIMEDRATGKKDTVRR